MTLQNALKLKKDDTVTVKKTKETLKVTEIEITSKEHTSNNMTCVDIHLSNGEWYGYKEIR